MNAPALVVLAHGSKDARSAATIRSLVERIGRIRPELHVEAAFLDHCAPDLPAVVRRLATRGRRDIVVVPLLLTAAYHSRVDVPLAVAIATDLSGPQVRVRTAAPLGTPTTLLDVLDRRLAESLGETGSNRFDALVLTAAGASDPAANAAVADLAAAWGERHGVVATAAFASSAPPAPSEAVRALRATGHLRIGVGSLFLAPGRLWDRAAELAREAGAITVAEPLGADDAITELVLSRLAEVAETAPSRA